jgi:hypothetical protein
VEPLWKKNLEASCNYLKWSKDRVDGEQMEGGGDITNIQCKVSHKCQNECPYYNEYMLIKMKKINGNIP